MRFKKLKTGIQIKIFLSVLAFVFVMGVHAQNILHLSDIRDSIHQNHPAFKMIEASKRAIDARAEGAYAWMPPEVGAGFFQAPYNVGKWKGTSSMPGMGMFMVSAEQMFPNKKIQDAEYRFMKSSGDIELQKSSGIMNELFSQARSAYYNLIVDEKKSEVIKQNKKLVDFMIQSAEIRYKNNLGNINSYYKLKAALAKLNTSGLVLEADKKQQRAIINNLLQQPEREFFSVDTTFEWYAFDQLIGDESVLTKTSEFKVIEKKIAANQFEQQLESASLKPQFGLKFEHMVGFGHQPQMFSLMAMLKLPMAKWSAKSNKARIEALNYETESLRSQQYAYLNREQGRSRSLFAEMEGIKRELKMYDAEIIPALNKNLQTLQISYEQNKAEIFELFDAWQSLLDARMEYLNSLQRGAQIQSELMSVFQIF